MFDIVFEVLVFVVCVAEMLFFYNFVFTFMIWEATPYLYNLKLRCKYEELDEVTNVS